MYGRMLLAGAAIAMFCQNAAGHGRGTDTPGGRPSHVHSFFPAPSFSKNPRGQPLDLRGRDITYASHAVDLSGLATRAEIFARWNNSEGWVPEP